MLPLILVSCHSLYMATTGNNCIGEQPKANSWNMIPETAQVAVCCPSYGLDLVHCGELLRVPIG
jgi:hypothetical protein